MVDGSGTAWQLAWERRMQQSQQRSEGQRRQRPRYREHGEECSGHGEDSSLRSAATCTTAARSSTRVHGTMGTEGLSGGAHWEKHMRRRGRHAQIFAACAAVNGEV